MIDFVETVGGTQGGDDCRPMTFPCRGFSEGSSTWFRMNHAQTDSAALRCSFTDTDNMTLGPNGRLPDTSAR